MSLRRRRTRRDLLTFVRGKDGDGLGRVSRGRRHDENGDVLLESEVARVEEPPEAAAVRRREDLGPRFTEDEGDNLKEQLRDVNGLRTEVEDLGTRGHL